MNRDGNIDALDAALILQHDAGLLPSFPAGNNFRGLSHGLATLVLW